MNHIPTTATAVQKLKRAAKTRRKATKESLAAAQNAVAREHGYQDWKHVTVCAESTSAAKREGPVVPATVSEFLAERRKTHPASAETQQAISAGLVFAMDVKDADSVRPEDSPEIHECDDAAAYVAEDIILAGMRRQREDGVSDEEESPDSGDELQRFLDDISNYRFFRYSGQARFETVDDAFAGPLREFFFPPTHLWIAGRFHDMADVRQVTVDGRVVYASSPAAPASQAGANATQPTAANSPPDTPITQAAQNGFIARLDVVKLEPSLYEFRVSEAGQELFSEAGFESITDALRAAADVTGIRGYEVAYRGLITGTYPIEQLANAADAVAQRAVEVAAAFSDF